MIITGIHRLEVIDHRTCRTCNGHKLVKVGDQPQPVVCPTCEGRGIIGRVTLPLYSPTDVELSLQDDNRTLKIFVTERPA